MHNHDESVKLQLVFHVRVMRELPDGALVRDDRDIKQVFRPYDIRIACVIQGPFCLCFVDLVKKQTAGSLFASHDVRLGCPFHSAACQNMETFSQHAKSRQRFDPLLPY